jgi:hypothetical protein
MRRILTISALVLVLVLVGCSPEPTGTTPSKPEMLDPHQVEMAPEPPIATPIPLPRPRAAVAAVTSRQKHGAKRPHLVKNARTVNATVHIPMSAFKKQAPRHKKAKQT